MTTLTAVDAGTREFLLALADDKHLMGQQHAEWIGVAPFLEEDLAFCSIGQDELGHAALVYELVARSDRGELGRPSDLDEAETDRMIDGLAFDRGAAEYRSASLVERAMPDWADAVVRHWLFDHADRFRWEQLATSSLDELGDIAARVEREERYHRRHAEALIESLMTDPDAAANLKTAAGRLAPLATGLFDAVAGEAEAMAAGITSGPTADRLDEWKALVEQRFGPIDWAASPRTDGRTARSEDFQPLMDRMREVIDVDVDAEW